jgi:hypothetical protein
MFLYIKTYQFYATLLNMNISASIRSKISKTAPGTLFGLKDFSEINNPQAVILELSRLSKKGVIKRLTKGKYFVPQKSRFGNLGPSELEILNRILQENGGYFGGPLALNRIGVTTQVPAEILIRGARSTRKLKVGNLNIRFERQGIKNSKHSPKITDVIEALRLLKNTPDGNTKLTIDRVSSLLKKYNKDEVRNLIRASHFERPFVRALLGAILELQGNPIAQTIKASLNPVSKYKLNIEKTILPNKDNWSII